MEPRSDTPRATQMLVVASRRGTQCCAVQRLNDTRSRRHPTPGRCAVSTPGLSGATKDADASCSLQSRRADSTRQSSDCAQPGHGVGQPGCHAGSANTSPSMKPRISRPLLSIPITRGDLGNRRLRGVAEAHAPSPSKVQPCDERLGSSATPWYRFAPRASALHGSRAQSCPRSRSFSL